MVRLPKFPLIAIGVLLTLLIVLVVQFISWTQNPYGLEEARLEPKGNERLPPVAPIPNAKNFLLFAAHEANDFAIHLPLPNDYIHPSRATSRFVTSYAAAATMYYPEMHSGFHPKNAHLLKCGGYCEGYIRAYIKVKESGARMEDEQRMTWIARDRDPASSRYSFETLESEFGLDDHFQIR